MNVKHIIKLTSQVLAAGGALKAFTKAKREGDTLKMVEAGLAAASVVVTVAVVVREVRQGEDNSRVVELEDAS